MAGETPNLTSVGAEASASAAEQPGRVLRVAGAVLHFAEGVADFAANHGLGQVSHATEVSTSVGNVSRDRRHNPGDFSAFSPTFPDWWDSTRRT